MGPKKWVGECVQSGGLVVARQKTITTFEHGRTTSTAAHHVLRAVDKLGLENAEYALHESWCICLARLHRGGRH